MTLFFAAQIDDFHGGKGGGKGEIARFFGVGVVASEIKNTTKFLGFSDFLDGKRRIVFQRKSPLLPQ